MSPIHKLISLLTKGRIKVSVILPVYNSEQTLSRCLDSIFAQNSNTLEVIAVNDSSSDASLDILNQYRQRYPNLRIINHKKNTGPGNARNNAITVARGKYIVFIDSDDWIDDTYLSVLYSKAEKTNADMVFSNVVFVDNGTRREIPLYHEVLRKYNKDNVSLTDFACDWRYTAPWMKMFRKDFVLKHDLKFLGSVKVGAEDIPFTWIAYFVAKRISFCENVYYYYHYDNTAHSLDSRVDEDILQIFNVLDYTKREYSRFDQDNERRDQLDTLYISHAYYQFGKIIGAAGNSQLKLRALYWERAHESFLSISSNSIISNKYLQDKEREYFFDVSTHSIFDEEMKAKYIS